ARQVAGLADEREAQRRRQARVERTPGPTPAKQLEVAREERAVVAHVVEVAVNAADAQVEGRARREAQDGGEAQTPKRARRVERGFERGRRARARQIKNGDGDSEFDDARERVGRGRREREAD